MLTIIFPFALHPSVKLQRLTASHRETLVQRFKYGYSVILSDFSGNLSVAQVALRGLTEDEVHQMCTGGGEC